jgi:hypothetical protein
MMKKALPLLLVSIACGGRSGTDDDGIIIPPEFFCPQSDKLTVCDLKLAGSAHQPAIGDPISLTGVVVTTPTVGVSFNMGQVTLAAFYVQDPSTTDDLGDRFSGIAVTYKPGMITVPPVGAVVGIEGTYDEFGREGATKQKQVGATFVTATGTREVRVAEVGIDGIGPDYEGTVVRLNGTVATMINPPGAGGMPIYGFQLDQKVIVATVLARYFAEVGEEFTSVTGVYRLGTTNIDSGIYSLLPRTAADIVPKNPIARVTSIRAVQDPASPDRPADMCARTQAGTTGRCPKISLTNVVVTAAGGYVSADLRSLWVQDPSVADGRYAGIKVVYGRDDPAPSVGDMVNVEGEVIEWFRGLQVQFARFTPSGGPMTPAPVVVDPTAIPRTSDPSTNPYEGVLVQIQNVQVVDRCTEDSMYRDHGNWIVTGDVLVGTSFTYDYNGMLRPPGTMCDGRQGGNCSCDVMSRPNDQRMDGDMFSTITGVIDFSFDELRLNPRSNSDLVR